MGRNYQQFWASMRNVKFRPLQRFATEERVVDDPIVTFEVAKDGYWHFPLDSKVERRMAHILRDLRRQDRARDRFRHGRTV